MCLLRRPGHSQEGPPKALRWQEAGRVSCLGLCSTCSGSPGNQHSGVFPSPATDAGDVEAVLELYFFNRNHWKKPVRSFLWKDMHIPSTHWFPGEPTGSDISLNPTVPLLSCSGFILLLIMKSHSLNSSWTLCVSKWWCMSIHTCSEEWWECQTLMERQQDTLSVHLQNASTNGGHHYWTSASEYSLHHQSFSVLRDYMPPHAWVTVQKQRGSRGTADWQLRVRHRFTSCLCYCSSSFCAAIRKSLRLSNLYRK